MSRNHCVHGVLIDAMVGRLLQVARRRIYDVVNVLQSIGVVTRMGKNLYDWIGAAGLRLAVSEVRSVLR